MLLSLRFSGFKIEVMLWESDLPGHVKIFVLYKVSFLWDVRPIFTRIQIKILTRLHNYYHLRYRPHIKMYPINYLVVSIFTHTLRCQLIAPEFLKTCSKIYSNVFQLRYLAITQKSTYLNFNTHLSITKISTKWFSGTCQ